jgi:hypothetical protein
MYGLIDVIPDQWTKKKNGITIDKGRKVGRRNKSRTLSRDSQRGFAGALLLVLCPSKSSSAFASGCSTSGGGRNAAFLMVSSL